MDKFNSLILDIGLEKQNLSRLVGELSQMLPSLTGELTFIEVRAAGSILHDFYTGLEKIFERITLAIDGGLPEGEGWHIQLLRRMLVNVPERRPAILTADLGEELSEYLAFRHLFRNIYGFELKRERLRVLAEKLPEIFKAVDNQLQQFTDFLAKL